MAQPIEIIDRLNKDINAALASPVMKARLADMAAPCCQAHLPSSES
jgi:hypothetical protein